MGPIQHVVSLFRWSVTIVALAAVLSAALLTSLSASPTDARSGLTFEPGDRVVVITDALNVRSGPSLNDTVVHVVTDGMLGTVTDGPVTADDHNWYQVTFDADGHGWVSGGYLTTADNGDGGYPGGERVVVNTDWLNVRAEPGLGGTVVNVLPDGYVAFIADGPISVDGYTWYQVDAMGVSLGWVAGEFLAPADGGGNGFPIGTRVAVDTDALYVRAAAGLDAKVVNVLPNGYVAFISGEPVAADGYTWYQVDAMGVTLGWVAGEFLAHS
ncbi:MAG: SH3 domain-containing protein [Thermomicrobiales bacterium]